MAEAEEEPAGAGVPDDLDMMVLPGESLAKYSGPEGGAGPASDFDSVELEVAVDEEPEAAGENPIDVVTDPQPELAQAVEEVIDEVSEAAEVPELARVEAATAEAAEPLTLDPEASIEIAEDIDVVPSDAAESEDSSEIPEAESAEEQESSEGLEAAEVVEGEAESPEAGESAESGENGMAEPEGPEPARIPTSLTATLREQGQNPRFSAAPHLPPHAAESWPRPAASAVRAVKGSPGRRSTSRAHRNAPPKRARRHRRSALRKPARKAAPTVRRFPPSATC